SSACWIVRLRSFTLSTGVGRKAGGAAVPAFEPQRNAKTVVAKEFVHELDDAAVVEVGGSLYLQGRISRAALQQPGVFGREFAGADHLVGVGQAEAVLPFENLVEGIDLADEFAKSRDKVRGDEGGHQRQGTLVREAEPLELVYAPDIAGEFQPFPEGVRGHRLEAEHDRLRYFTARSDGFGCAVDAADGLNDLAFRDEGAYPVFPYDDPVLNQSVQRSTNGLPGAAVQGCEFRFTRELFS